MAEDEESFVDDLGVEKTSNEIDDLVGKEVNECSIMLINTILMLRGASNELKDTYIPG